MANRVWGPHVSGLTVWGFHIGACTEVDSDGGAVPDSLTISFSAQPGGSTAQIHPVQNGASASLDFGTNARLIGVVNNCRDVPGTNGAPDSFVFQFTIRAEGEISVPHLPFPIPLGVQIDAFDIAIVKDPARRQEVAAAQLGIAVTP